MFRSRGRLGRKMFVRRNLIRQFVLLDAASIPRRLGRAGCVLADCVAQFVGHRTSLSGVPSLLDLR